MVEIASFYPNLCAAIKVKVLDAEEVFASNDSGAANSEIRHFIDKAYLASIPGGVKYLDSIVEPTPPCKELWGTKHTTSEVVVGMLSKRLPVSIYAGPTQGWLRAKLQNILVIDKLPVPIHVSSKALKLYPDSEVMYGSLRVQLKKSTFPTSFHSHPYWIDDESMYTIGSIDDNRTESIKKGASGRPNIVEKGKACSNCGTTNCTLTCSRCKVIIYCGVDCQRSDWVRHKKECKKLRV